MYKNRTGSFGHLYIRFLPEFLVSTDSRAARSHGIPWKPLACSAWIPAEASGLSRLLMPLVSSGIQQGQNRTHWIPLASQCSALGAAISQCRPMPISQLLAPRILLRYSQLEQWSGCRILPGIGIRSLRESHCWWNQEWNSLPEKGNGRVSSSIDLYDLQDSRGSGRVTRR
jgi:hypothetical protein